MATLKTNTLTGTSTACAEGKSFPGGLRLKTYV